MAGLLRELRVSTDGAKVSLEYCALTPLELKSVLDLLLQALLQGTLAFPQGVPILSLVEEDEIKEKESAPNEKGKEN